MMVEEVREAVEEAWGLLVRSCFDIGLQFVEENLTYCCLMEQQLKEVGTFWWSSSWWENFRDGGRGTGRGAVGDRGTVLSGQ